MFHMKHQRFLKFPESLKTTLVTNFNQSIQLLVLNAIVENISESKLEENLFMKDKPQGSIKIALISVQIILEIWAIIEE